MNNIKLTAENYYSAEANIEYFSVSQFKDFLRCPAMATAKLNGAYEPKITNALLVGQFVDRYFEGTLDEFKQEHSEIFTRQGTLKSDFKKADEIVETVQNYPLFMRFMSGEKQKILTFEMFGQNWKMKMDSFIPDTCITDLKITRTISTIPQWRYDIQGAIYQKGCELNGYGRLPFYLAVATKEETTDVRIFQIPQSVLDNALKEVEDNIEHFAAIKAGLVEPERCDDCDYCRKTRELQIENYIDLLK